jgi:molybdate transport system permease protein
MVLGWSRSLGEFGATITFNGNYPGTTQTMPVLIYTTRQSDQDAAQAMSLVMLALSLAVLLLLRDRWLGDRGLGDRGLGDRGLRDRGLATP